PVVGRHMLDGGIGSGAGALDGRFYPAAGLVLQGSKRELVLECVCQLDIPYGVLCGLDLPCNPFVALAAEADRPLDRGALADFLRPFAVHTRKVIGEDAGRAAAVGAMDDHDRLVREVHTGVVIGNPLVVPLGDLAEEDVRDILGVEFEPFGYSGKVVGNDNCSHDRRYVQQFARSGFQLFIGKELVGSAEINGLGGDLLDPAAAAYGLVVEFHAGVDLGVFAEPLRIEGVGESSTGAVDERLGTCEAGCCHKTGKSEYTYFLEHLSSP